MSPVVTKVALPSSEAIYMEYKALGIELTKSGNQWRTLCPFPDHIDTAPSFFVYPDGGFHCFGCGAHGSLEDIYNFFELDFRYHTSRIDLTTLPDAAIDFMPQLRKHLEKQIRLVLDKCTDCFSIYDAFDRLWLDLGFVTFTNRLQMVIIAKRKFYTLFKNLEESYVRNERVESD